MNLRIRYILLLYAISLSVTGQDSFKQSSVLKSGTWYKVKVSETSVYKLTYENLKSIGFEAPENIRVYGLTGNQCSYTNEAEVDSDLEELAIYSSNNNDFGPGDYYLFYAEGVETVYFDEDDNLFRQKIHEYALSNYYFITSSFGPGKRIESLDTEGLTPNLNRSSYNWVGYIEDETYNLINSGKKWVGERFAQSNLEKPFTVNNLINDSLITVETSVTVRSDSYRQIDVSVNGTRLGSMNFSPVVLGNSEAIYARSRTFRSTAISTTPSVNIALDFDGALTDDAYLDYILVNARARLVIDKDAYFFRDITSVGEDNITRFTLSNGTSSYKIWDVTNHNNVVGIPYNISGSSLQFTKPTIELSELLAVNTQGSFNTPVFTDNELNDVGWLENNQNLHAESTPELLIVTHPVFIEQAKELAQLHRDEDNMKVLVATTVQIYNEFSSGKPDISAIRNFARMLYERSSAQDSLKYLLLFGDGTYDNRSLNSQNANYIPTLQSGESLDPQISYVTDDFYARLEIGEGESNGSLDVGVGRLPSNAIGNDVSEAQTMVDKIKLFYDNALMTDWRNRIIFHADDGESGWDDVVFMEDSDELIDIISAEAPALNVSKIYNDAYQQISSSAGASYPEVKEALNEAFNKGALLFNYMGHGGENGITQEQVFTKSDFENLQNAPYFPLFMTATCQLSRYDNIDINANNYARKVSAGEAALLNPNGGAIALFTTTRLVFQNSNLRLSESIYENLFKKDYQGERYRLGDVFRTAKNTTSAPQTNTYKFALLGDPAITLPHGQYHVMVDSVNNLAVAEVSDTINALSEVKVSGHIADNDSIIMDAFDGVVFLSVFDKSYIVTSNGNDNTETYDFEVQDKILFRGKASVENGRFSIAFKVPKDISYSFGEGKMSFYAENGIIDAKGSFTDFIIGGTSPDAEVDFDGPELTLFMNDSSFVDGGITNPSPVLIAYIRDENGINTTGNGIGHDLVGVLDGEQTKSYMLNDYFSGDLNSYKSGVVRYPLYDLEEGYHDITVKVWDTYNNSSEATIGFYVAGSNSLALNDVMNYPNPARNSTIFRYEHNQPGSEHNVVLDIFDTAGRLVYRLERNTYEEGYVSSPLMLDFNSGSWPFIAPGVYPYRITVNTSNGYNGIQSGKLIIIP